ncbi:MAG: SurA N-terminal domain-containing protein [Armatimonadota bacterium]
MKIATLLPCAAVVWMVAGPPALAHEGHEAAAPAATVNGIPISGEEFADALRTDLARLRAFGPREDAALSAAMATRAASQALLALVQEKLIRAEAQRRDLRASAFEVAARLAREERRYESEADFEDALLRQGLTRESLAASFELRLLEAKLKQDIGAEKPTEAEARAYYEQHPNEFVEKLMGGRTRQVPYEDAAATIKRRLRARRRDFGYFDWLRQALASAQVSLDADQLQHAAGAPVQLRWPVDQSLSPAPGSRPASASAPSRRP